MSNCRNCGAPLTRTGECPYCGTKGKSLYGDMVSQMEITADAIRFTAFIPNMEENDNESKA